MTRTNPNSQSQGGPGKVVAAQASRNILVVAPPPGDPLEALFPPWETQAWWLRPVMLKWRCQDWTSSDLAKRARETLPPSGGSMAWTSERQASQALSKAQAWGTWGCGVGWGGKCWILQECRAEWSLQMTSARIFIFFERRWYRKIMLQVGVYNGSRVFCKHPPALASKFGWEPGNKS